MGRVARYKRIKAIDPANPKTHGVVPEKLSGARELAPRGVSVHRQPLPRSLRDLQAVQGHFAGPAKAPRAPDPHSLRHVADLPGESMASFKRRLKTERRRLLAELGRAPLGGGVSEKRKAFLEKRGKKRKGNGGEGSGAQSGDGGGGGGGGAARGGARAAGHADDGGDASAAPFASRFVDYHPSLLPANLLRAKRKREGGGEGKREGAESHGESCRVDGVWVAGE